MQPLYFCYLAVMLVSAVAAVIFSPHLASRRLTILAIFLPSVFLMEVYQGWLLYIQKESTAPIYNIYKPLSVVTFAFIYYSIPFMYRFRKIIVSITGFYLLIVIATYLLIDSQFSINNTYLTLARGICITFFGVFFLMSVLLLDDLEKEKFWEPLIWVTIGIVTFYPVASIALGFHRYLRDYNATLSGMKLYQAVPQLMSIFMYSCFTYAFLLCKRKS